MKKADKLKTKEVADAARNAASVPQEPFWEELEDRLRVREESKNPPVKRRQINEK